MPVESDQDRADMLADFGETVTITPAGYPHPSSKTITLTAIFDYEYVEAGGTSGNRPTLLCRTSDIAGNGISEGALVTAGGVNYEVKVPMPDSTGFMTLVLEKQ